MFRSPTYKVRCFFGRNVPSPKTGGALWHAPGLLGGICSGNVPVFGTYSSPWEDGHMFRRCSGVWNIPACFRAVCLSLLSWYMFRHAEHLRNIRNISARWNMFRRRERVVIGPPVSVVSGCGTRWSVRRRRPGLSRGCCIARRKLVPRRVLPVSVLPRRPRRGRTSRRFRI